MKRNFALTVFALAIVFGLIATTTVLADGPAEDLHPFYDCDIDVALIKSGEYVGGRFPFLTQRQPKWVVATTDAEGRNSLPAVDRWGKPLDDPRIGSIQFSSWVEVGEWIQEWSELTGRPYEYLLYNETGLFAWGEGDYSYTDPYRCRVATTPEEGAWLAEEHPLATHTFGANYRYREEDKNLPTRFESTFRIGKILTQVELEWVYQNPTRHWQGLGFVGGSDSAERFTIDGDGNLGWVWSSWGGTTPGEQSVGFRLLLERRIVVDTTHFYEDGSERKTTQRIVLIRNRGPLEQYHDRIDMLEVLD